MPVAEPAGRAAGWLFASPPHRWASRGRRLLALGGLVAAGSLIPIFQRLADPAEFRVPRIPGFEPGGWFLVLVLGLWIIGSLALVFDRSSRSLGWSLPIAAAITLVLDAQIPGAQRYLIAILAPVFIAHEWMQTKPKWEPFAGVPLRAAQAQISIVFFWTALAKMNGRFLSGGILYVGLGEGVLTPPAFLLQPWVLRVMAAGVVVVELVIAVGLWVPRWRRTSLLLALLLHAGIVLLLQPVVVLISFALVMGAGYALFAAEPWSRPTTSVAVGASRIAETSQVARP